MRERRFGVELEYTLPINLKFKEAIKSIAKITGHECYIEGGKGGGSGPNCWALVSEPSARSEINTPAFSSALKFRAAIKRLLPLLPQSVRGLSQTCGMHVHVEVADLRQNNHRSSSRELLSLAEIFVDVEPHLFALAQVHPRRRIYCEPLREGWKELLEVLPGETDFRDLKPKQARQYLDFLLDRNFSFNLSAYHDYGTIEIRIANSSTDSDTICNWSLLCRNIVNQAILTLSSNKKPPKLRSLSNLLEFSKSSKKIRRWAFDLAPIN